ncbi:hypothetical protein PoB_007454300 [Plakobranchus ocellatus]|uniref:Uncharacterized protein n=1 Tax=Plakobranchus ocellatus TaxID=259542 RepID=A0AAV4DVC1_9GAST|nr:hypothetical protein PoB_007454300 [Plakobranchus ocellatus]
MKWRLDKRFDADLHNLLQQATPRTRKQVKEEVQGYLETRAAPRVVSSARHQSVLRRPPSSWVQMQSLSAVSGQAEHSRIHLDTETLTFDIPLHHLDIATFTFGTPAFTLILGHLPLIFHCTTLILPRLPLIFPHPP